MIQDESQSALQPLQQQQSQQSQPQNSLGGIMQGAQPQQRQGAITKQQVIAGLHHLGAFQKQFGPLLKNPGIGKTNIRPKIFDAAASLIAERTYTVPEVMNGIKDLPDEPLEQKKWLETKLANAAMAEKKLVADYIAQGPGAEPDGPDWSLDSHRDHIGGLMGNYKRG